MSCEDRKDVGEKSPELVTPYCKSCGHRFYRLQPVPADRAMMPSCGYCVAEKTGENPPKMDLGTW